MDAVSSVEQMIVMDGHAIQLEVRKQRIRTKIVWNRNTSRYDVGRSNEETD